jgi:hypothetical protein
LLIVAGVTSLTRTRFDIPAGTTALAAKHPPTGRIGDGEDAVVSVRRPWHSLRRRPPTPPPPESITDLLDHLAQLRLTLTADLSAAAAALDAGEPTVARDIVNADRAELRRVQDAAAQPRSEPARVARGEPARTRRALLILPAIPLVGALAVTGAAALGMHVSAPTPVAGHHTSASVSDTNPALRIRETTGPTLRRLERMVSNHPKRAEVLAVATQLHQQLSAIIERSPNDVQSLNEVRRILTIEQHLLEGHRDQGTALALAASRRLTHLLHLDHAPMVGQTSPPQPSRQPTATSSPTTSSKPTPSVSPTPTIGLSAPSQTSAAKASGSRPTPTRSTQRRHHREDVNDPLFGSGLFDSAP